MDCLQRLRPFYSLILLVIIFSSCGRKPPTIQKAYYYWRSNDMNGAERKFLKQHSIDKVYQRIMDVDWSDVQGAIPVAPYNMEYNYYDLREYDSFQVQMVPVVFITNKTFERISDTALPQLATRVVRRCLPAYDPMDIEYEERHRSWRMLAAVPVNEIQIDCDWTVKTAPMYFKFLQEVRKLLFSQNVMLSTTIRLHQFRYPEKTGVPPADRGMLMVYNISNPKEYNTRNSIFDEEKAAAYFTGKKRYPLPLDIALPAWSWSIIYRNKKFYQIENSLSAADLDEMAFLKKVDGNIYQVTSDTVYDELFLRPGDEIRAEGIDSLTLLKATSLAGKARNTDTFTISLFELSEHEFKQYSDATFDKVYSSFR